MLKLIFVYVLAVAFFIGGFGFFSHIFIWPFFDVSPEVVSADPYYFVSLILGLSAGFFMMAPVNILSKHLRGKELKITTLAIVSMSFGVFALVLNMFLYSEVISPLGLTECNARAGYNKNLLTDYVKNIESCRSD
ncbi:hypothetical protein KSS82_04775 [Vibrio mimicus]|nr:hypothetical protein [Vibrio mimicus]QXC55607.1 hypothetical protein KSS82_04775 [Vibrio mimicus]